MKKVLVYLSALPMLALAPFASALTCDEVRDYVTVSNRAGSLPGSGGKRWPALCSYEG